MIYRKNRLLLFACLLLVAPFVLHALEPVETDNHILTTLAEGVYAIRHKRAAQIRATSGNTTVIVGDRDVLVVDSCLLPSIAQSDIELIRKWTDKPVRYLVNTHWHGDHTWGNGVYLEAFPQLAIIAHKETPRLMEGYLTNFIPINIAYPAKMKEMMSSGKDYDGSTLTEERRTEIVEDMPNAELRAAEYKTLVTQLPNLTFDSELNLDLGNRVVQIKHLGRGNTSGDIIVYLPKEKIVVTGDLLVYPWPYTLGGFPTEWMKTLKRISELDADTIVPGHGAVLAGEDGKNYLTLVTDLLETVLASVARETFIVGNNSNNLETVKEAVKKDPQLALVRKRFAGEDPEKQSAFDSMVQGLIASAYREAWGN